MLKGVLRRSGVRMAAATEVTVHSISTLYTMDAGNEGVEGDKRLGMIKNAAVAFSDGKVTYVGPTAGAPKGDTEIDGTGMVGMPGLVDSHTHLVYAGSRSAEFGKRLAGAKYTDILEAGGGINVTVQATREASYDELLETARARVGGMLKRGVTSIEVKSGYGLEPEAELKMLKVACALKDTADIHPTFLGAHTVPNEWRHDQTGYVESIIVKQLPLVKDYCEAVDIYCDKGAFTLDESVKILEAAKKMGLKIKAHAEQVAYTGIAEAAAKMGAVSVDHLERLDANGVQAMKENDTVAVILPGAQMYLKDTPPPVEQLRAAGIKMAVATDMNPGSSPVHDLWMCATLSCIIQGLTMEEALLGITAHGGDALGRPDLGRLSLTSAANMSLQQPPPGEPPIMESLLQHISGHKTTSVILGGKVVI